LKMNRRKLELKIKAFIRNIRPCGPPKPGAALAACLAAMLCAPSSFAGPPFLTDDPSPTETGHTTLFIASQHDVTHEDWIGTLPHFEFDYGVIPNVELHLLTPFVFNHPRDTGTMLYGYGDTELGIKWRAVDENGLFEGSPAIGTSPLFDIPTGDEDRGLGGGKARYFIPLFLQKSWGEENRRWTTYGGGGYRINPAPGNEDFWYTGWVLQRQVTDTLTLGGELFYITPETDDSSSRLGFNLGGMYDFSEHWHLLFSAGRDFHGPDLLLSYLAIQLTF
jgi:hypothetical protein